MNVSDIIIHSDWDPTQHTYDADLAILVTERNIEFNDAIRAICLPLSDNATQITKTGTIVSKRKTTFGWGRSEEADYHESTLKHTRVDYVTNEVCFTQHSRFADIASVRTFCAGGSPGQRIGPCHGDRFAHSLKLVSRLLSQLSP